jgi:hypothetical protein
VHLAHIEAHASVTKQDLERDRPLHGADDGAIFGRDLIDIVRGNDRAGTRPVLHDDRRLTRNMPSQVTRYRTRSEIVAAADIRPDHDINRLSLVELSN